MLYIANITIMVQFISPTFYLLLTIRFPLLNIFPAQKIRNNTVKAPYGILGASTEGQNNLRIDPIFESNIGFLFELDHYSSD